MNVARKLYYLKRCNVGNSFFRKYRISSANYDATQTTAPQIKEEKFDFEDIQFIERTERRKPPIPPFMKDVMVSIFNRDLLAYPEILNKEESDALDSRVNNLSLVFKNVESSEKERENAAKQSGLFGAPLNLTKGGLAMNVTERIRYLETVSSDLRLATRLSDHWVALEALKLGLSEDAMRNLMPELVDGDKTITLCNKEPPSIRIGQTDFRTHAQMDGQGVWRVNGKKICHDSSGYFLVLSTVEAGRIKAFLVHPNAEGVKYVKPYITLRNTPCTPVDVMSDEVLSRALSMSRLDKAVICYSLLKHTIMNVVQHVRGKFISGRSLSEVATIRSKIGEALLTVYAAESMAYFTAGLLDGYHDPDADLEKALCRTFVTQHGLEAMITLLSIPGMEGAGGAWAASLHDWRELMLVDETNEDVNLFIGLTGIQHAGKIMATEVKQMRNPLFHPTFILKKVFAERHQEADDPKLTLRLAQHLHPSLRPPADQLEYAALRMRFAAETMLGRHGLAVTGALTELVRLAQAASDVYAMTAVLARASRSYCIGVRNAEMEMKLSATFVEMSKLRLQKLINDVVDGEYLNLDRFRVEFGQKVLDTQTLLVEKPTERVFW